MSSFERIRPKHAQGAWLFERRSLSSFVPQQRHFRRKTRVNCSNVSTCERCGIDLVQLAELCDARKNLVRSLTLRNGRIDPMFPSRTHHCSVSLPCVPRSLHAHVSRTLAPIPVPLAIGTCEARGGRWHEGSFFTCFSSTSWRRLRVVLEGMGVGLGSVEPGSCPFPRVVEPGSWWVRLEKWMGRKGQWNRRRLDVSSPTTVEAWPRQKRWTCKRSWTCRWTSW